MRNIKQALALLGLGALLVNAMGCQTLDKRSAEHDAQSLPRTTAPVAASSVSGSGPRLPSRVFDAHIHTPFDGKPERSSGIIVSREELLKEMKEANVVGAISMQRDFMDENPDLSADGIKYCAGLREKINYKRLESEIKQGRVVCIKIYLGYVHRWASDKAYQPAYRLAEKYDIPVAFHTGDTYSSVAKLKYADPLTIDEVAVAYPKVKFVIAHMGNPWIQSAAEVAYKNPNVYVEGSAFFAGPMAEYPQERIDSQMVKQIKWVFDYVENPKKILFGTDWPLVPLKDYVTAFARAIPEKDWDAVFYQNALDVYRPDRPVPTSLKTMATKYFRKKR